MKLNMTKNIYSNGMNNGNEYNPVTLSGFQTSSSYVFYNHNTSSRLKNRSQNEGNIQIKCKTRKKIRFK